MSHLGDRLSALVDGELNGTDRERAHAHMAVCEPCRVEAAALRDLKRELRDLRALRALPAEEAVVGRLLEMAGPGGPIPPRQRRQPRQPRQRRRRFGGGRTRPGAPHPAWHPGRPSRLGRRGYVVAGAVSLVVVGIGAAAFSVGGGGSSGPDITPPMQMYSEEHAITTGDVPFPVLSTGGASRSPKP
jgi:anti-sigma factor RsiW